VVGQTVTVAPPATASVPQGTSPWWTVRRQAWVANHPRLVRALRRAWITWTVGTVVVYLLALSFVPAWRTASVPWLWGYYALLLVFLAARTKTVSWRFVAGAFSAGALLAPVIGALEIALAGLIGADVGFRDGTVLIAGPVEEVLKLTPLLAVLVFARRRRRGLATVDFLLVGFASGLGFQVVEDAIRRIALTQRAPSLADVLTQLEVGVPGLPHYGWGWLTGGAVLSDPVAAHFPGHAVTTAIAAAGIGLGFRLRRRRGPLTLVVPMALLAMVTVDHAKFNDTASAPLFEMPAIPRPDIDPRLLPEGFDLPELPQDHEVDTPAWLDRAWELGGRGRHEPALLTGLLVAGLVLDDRRYRRALPHLPPVPPLSRARSRAQTPGPPGPAPPTAAGPQPAGPTGFAPPGVQAPGAPPGPGPGLVGSTGFSAPPSPTRSGAERVLGEVARSVGHTVVDIVHEAALTFMALGHDPPATWAHDARAGLWSHPDLGWARFDRPTQRWVMTTPDGTVTTAPSLPLEGPSGRPPPPWRRWLVALVYLRGRRQLAQQIEDRADEQRSRRGPAAMLLWALVAGALTAGVLVALYALYGTRLDGADGAFLAGLLEDFADWWHGLSWAEQTLLIVGVAGLLTLGFGVAFWPAFYWLGAASLVPQHGYGLAESLRDPAGIDDRLAHLTPQEVAWYSAEGVLTFWGGPSARPGVAWRRQLDEVAEREIVQRAVPAAEHALPDIARDAPIQLGGLDDMGRATGATANVTPEMIGSGSRPYGVDPPGLNTDLGHARGHLIAAQLGGTGRDARNLVTLFQTRANSPEMRSFETMVRRAVDAGEIVQSPLPCTPKAPVASTCWSPF
jgi:RsiW-degrading membrane proteinase PrsW (M82 family)